MTTTNIASNLETVRNEIKSIALECGRDPDEITLVAVSKTRTLSEVSQAIEAGQLHFGENTVQDALTKIPETDNQASWHFIGHLQSKKARQIPGNFQWIHSVDSLKLANKLAISLAEQPETETLNCLLQVNVSGEASKYGLMPEDVRGFIDQCLQLDTSQLVWRGLMTIGVKGDEQKTRDAFSALRELQELCAEEFSLKQFDQLSMGMSNDYGIAIEEGATLVRIGTSIFGPRYYGDNNKTGATAETVAP